MEKKIVGYARVNLTERAESAPALDRQVERLKAQGATEIFADITSGAAEERSQFSLMMASIPMGEVQEVVVTRVDRLTRSLVQLGKCIEIFDDSGVNLRILDQ